MRDSGIGLEPEQVTRVFDSFAQADASTTRKYGGTGLGLTVTRKFCEMMGGDIDVVSEAGKGRSVHCAASGASRGAKRFARLAGAARKCSDRDACQRIPGRAGARGRFSAGASMTIPLFRI